MAKTWRNEISSTGQANYLATTNKTTEQQSSGTVRIRSKHNWMDTRKAIASPQHIGLRNFT